MMALLSVLPAAKAQDHDFSNMEKEYPLLMQRYGDGLVYLVLQTGMVSGLYLQPKPLEKEKRKRNFLRHGNALPSALSSRDHLTRKG